MADGSNSYDDEFLFPTQLYGGMIVVHLMENRSGREHDIFCLRWENTFKCTPHNLGVGISPTNSVAALAYH